MSLVQEAANEAGNHRGTLNANLALLDAHDHATGAGAALLGGLVTAASGAVVVAAGQSGELRLTGLGTTAPIISQTTAAGALVIRTAASSYLRFDTGGSTERMRIAADGTVSVGATQDLTLTGGSSPIIAQTTAAGSLVYRTASNSYHTWQTDGGTERMRLNYGNPGSGITALMLMTNNGGSVAVRQVEVGAADSGGTGYRLMRVAN